MKTFGLLHLTVLVLIAAFCVVLSMLLRQGRIPARAARLAIGWGIIANELIWWCYRYGHEGLHLWNLPFQLCDVTLWASAIACLTLAPRLVEFAYFGGMAGAGMALITPDLWSPWPSYPAIYFFLAHGGIVLAVAILVFGRVAPLRSGAVWRAFGMLLAFAALVGTVNAFSGANFMYLCRKPKAGSLLDSFGPWPIYLAVGAVVALGLFWLLWLPVRPGKTRAALQ